MKYIECPVSVGWIEEQVEPWSKEDESSAGPYYALDAATYHRTKSLLLEASELLGYIDIPKCDEWLASRDCAKRIYKLLAEGNEE